MRFIVAISLCAMLPFFALSASEKAGETELIVGQTINGGFLLTLFMFSLDDDRDSLASFGPWAGGITGTTLGLYSSQTLVKSRDDITVADAQLVNSASVWGSLQGAAIGSVFFGYNPTTLRLALLSNAGLTAAAIQSANSQVIESGKVAFINSAGMWGAIFTIATPIIFDVKPDLPLQFLIGSSLGLLGGSLVKNNGDFTRSEVAKNDLEGIKGAFIGVGVVALLGVLSLNIPDFEFWIAGAVIGAATYLVLAYSKGGSAHNTGPVNTGAKPQVQDSYYSFQLGQYNL